MSDDSAERNPVEVLAEEFLRASGVESGRRSVSTSPGILSSPMRSMSSSLSCSIWRTCARTGTMGPTRRLSRSDQFPAEWVTTAFCARSVGAAWPWSTRPNRSRLGVASRSRYWPARRITPQLVRRFEREARSAARLHHTNIVPVFGVGNEGNVHYYVMQYIPGQPLDQVLKEVRRLRRGNHRSGKEPAGASVVRAEDRPSASQVAISLWSGKAILSVIEHCPDGRVDSRVPPD